jgi:hypothetical protein
VKPQYPLIEIWWDDAHCQIEQTLVEDLAEDQDVCTVGYLVRETDRSVTIAAEVLDGSPDAFRSATRIPKGMIREMRPLTRTKSRSRKRIGEKS